MKTKRVVKYIAVGLGGLIALAILVLTVSIVKHYRDKLANAQQLNCQVNWCQGELIKSGSGYQIRFVHPLRKNYSALSFNNNLDRFINHNVQVKGVLSQNDFVITAIKTD